MSKQSLSKISKKKEVLIVMLKMSWLERLKFVLQVLITGEIRFENNAFERKYKSL